ncbi:MAG: rhomboid-like protein [Acidimicrobiales bacterium]
MNAVAAWVGRPWEPRATQTYAAIVAVTTLWASAADDRLALAALRTASTNLHGLARQPLTVLVASAMWADPGGWRGYLMFLVAAVLVLGPVERRLGTGRWLIAFVGGHAGATLITAAGLWLAIETGRADRSLSRVVDVGWSYGTIAVAAVGTGLAPAGTRRWWAAVLVVVCAAGLARHPDVTGVGHVVAGAIGFGLAPWLTPGADREQRV